MARRCALILLVLLAIPNSSFPESKGNVSAPEVSNQRHPQSSEDRESLLAVRHSPIAGGMRVVLELTGAVTYSEHWIDNPPRLYFDLSQAVIRDGFRPPAVPGTDDVVRGMRVAQFDAGTVRFVLELGRLESHKVVSLGHKLVIDLFGDAEKTGHREASAYTVVLDPGHGGEDPGAMGPGGLREKDVVLDVAKRLRKSLVETAGVRVVLTREDDVFVPLLERTRIANRERADLFVSIHVNAVDGKKRRSVRGVETYLLNWRNTKEAERVAARENRILVRAGEQRPDMSVLDTIFSDLSREYKRDESLRLAHRIQDSVVGELKRGYREIRDLGVKQGRFYVLLGATMPAVLAEISFITHPREAKRLATDSYREAIAGGLFRGVSSYLEPERIAQNYP